MYRVLNTGSNLGSKLTGSCVYTDGFSADYRLVTELVKSAHKNGAICLTRSALTSAKQENGRHTLKVRDGLNDQDFEIKAKHVLTAQALFVILFEASLIYPRF